jgi:hypothetical protein
VKRVTTLLPCHDDDDGTSAETQSTRGLEATIGVQAVVAGEPVRGDHPGAVVDLAGRDASAGQSGSGVDELDAKPGVEAAECRVPSAECRAPGGMRARDRVEAASTSSTRSPALKPPSAECRVPSAARRVPSACRVPRVARRRAQLARIGAGLDERRRQVPPPPSPLAMDATQDRAGLEAPRSVLEATTPCWASVRSPKASKKWPFQFVSFLR